MRSLTRTLRSTLVCGTAVVGLICLPSRVPAQDRSGDHVPPRIVAIGDLHGDLRATRSALRLAGAIDSTDHWIGGPLVVVQTGDLFDRGDDEVQMVALLQRLERDAAAAGGALRLLNGNHELMNAYLDFRYVTDSGFRAFAVDSVSHSEIVLPSKITAEARGRAIAFRPGGRIARILATQPTILQIGTTVFVHGGVLPANVTLGIGALNQAVGAWLRGEQPQPTWIKGSESPVWNRVYSKKPDAAACAQAARVLRSLGATHMVVGHSIQKKGITSYCGGSVWAIDVGMSHFAGGKVQVLEIAGERIRPLGPIE